jgi:hypothetical protein
MPRPNARRRLPPKTTLTNRPTVSMFNPNPVLCVIYKNPRFTQQPVPIRLPSNDDSSDSDSL